MKKIVIACDHGAVDLKKEIIAYLKNKNIEINDLGTDGNTPVDYPDMALAACNEYKKGGYEFGIVLCGTGIGISIAANKINGIRCALIGDLFSAQMAKEHNNANFIAFGGRIKYAVPVTKMIEKFIRTDFAGDRHERRIAKITDLENL